MQLTNEQLDFCPLFRARQSVELLDQLVAALRATTWSSWQTTAEFMPIVEKAEMTLSCIKDET